MRVTYYLAQLQERKLCKNKREFHKNWLETAHHTYVASVGEENVSVTVMFRFYKNLLKHGLSGLAAELHSEMVSAENGTYDHRHERAQREVSQLTSDRSDSDVDSCMVL